MSSWLVLVLKDLLGAGAVVVRSAEAVLVLTLLVVVDAVLVRKRLVERRSEDDANEVPRR
jgi:hypothetical protein